MSSSLAVGFEDEQIANDRVPGINVVRDDVIIRIVTIRKGNQKPMKVGLRDYFMPGVAKETSIMGVSLGTLYVKNVRDLATVIGISNVRIKDSVVTVIVLVHDD